MTWMSKRETFRLRAKECRRLAEGLSMESRVKMLRVALEYERMAENAEQAQLDDQPAASCLPPWLRPA